MEVCIHLPPTKSSALSHRWLKIYCWFEAGARELPSSETRTLSLCNGKSRTRPLQFCSSCQNRLACKCSNEVQHSQVPRSSERLPLTRRLPQR